MAKLYARIEQIFKFRLMDNSGIEDYLKRMSSMGKIDDVKKIALFNLILTKLGEIEDKEAEKEISKEYIAKRYQAVKQTESYSGDGRDGVLIVGNEKQVETYDKPVDAIRTGQNQLTIESLKCPDCDMVAKSKLGLSSHVRNKHKK